MKKPIFLGVRPWFLIDLSCDKLATMDCAEHPGFAPTKFSTSFFNLSNLARFCEPLPNLLGTMSGNHREPISKKWW
jgi:hypothetical protein